MTPSPLKTLLTLAWPIIISRSTQVVIGLCDALLIAHLGADALASVTAGAMNSYALVIFPMGICFIVQSFSAQLTGKGDKVAARRYGWYGLWVAAIFQLIALASIPALPWIFSLFPYSPELSAGLCSYLSIRLIGTGAGVGLEALGNYYGGAGNTAILMKANVAAMILNVLFAWLLIDGHWGLPAMGVRGAAWGSVLSVALAFLWFFGVFLWHGRGMGRLGLKLSEFGRMMRFGLPSGLNWSFEFSAWILFVNIVVASLGTSSLAALMAVIQVNSCSFMPAFGLGSAGAILVGQSIGAGDREGVPALVKLTFKVSAVWMIVVGACYFAFPALILRPFVPAGQDLAGDFMTAGAMMLTVSAFWQVFDAAGITVGEALRAAGDTLYPMWARGALAWGVFLPASWIQVRYFGGTEKAAIAWLLIYLGLLALAMVLRFKSGAWKKIELVEETLPSA